MSELYLWRAKRVPKLYVSGIQFYIYYGSLRTYRNFTDKRKIFLQFLNVIFIFRCRIVWFMECPENQLPELHSL